MQSHNRLSSEASLYLRQHAGNPVDWFPWGGAAFAEARRRDVPVFLSVGYSACHWCHVMAHESFEDEQVAADLNSNFVSVKVDREERPDVDAVYMAATLAMNGHGGWPMSVFLTPDGRPFFAGTYFPPTDRGGLPGFRKLLGAISEAWHERREHVEEQADALAEAVAGQAAVKWSSPGGQRCRAGAGAAVGAGDGPVGTGQSPSLWTEALTGAMAQLSVRFDERWGGFGSAPKFPQPTFIELCLRQYRRAGDRRTLEMAERTLRAMATGGIRDHLGGGFCRYSTDDTWTVPHFEKMLYDQAGLLRVYVHAWQATGRPEWMAVAEDVVGYVLGDLALAGGGLCSAEDADSEGEEGRFYLWTPEELETALGAEAPSAARRFGLDKGPNFEGRSILRLSVDADLARSPEAERWRACLLAARAERVRPARDDKVLTEWNAMFCSALAEAAGAAGRADWAEAALSVAGFLWQHLCREDGRWMRSWQGGRAHHLAYAADYAWLVECATRLAELTGERRWLDLAADTAGELLRLFRSDDGPLRTTAEDAEALIVRPTEVLDDATPSATAVAGMALQRLGALRGDDALADSGSELLGSLSQLAEAQPLAVGAALLGGQLVDDGITEVVIAGRRPDMVAQLRGRYEPTAVLLWGERTDSPLWEGRVDGRAYVCRGRVCSAPAGTVEELVARLDEAAPVPPSSGPAPQAAAKEQTGRPRTAGAATR
ncbi:MAG TPA: thioredoxin domain-containing protein [Acidimicrobiales bacterium]|nr:thioredoxin domain-containing protein [Acidimicrobiales bacterium]